MKRDYSYINCRGTYSVSLRALTRYGFGKPNGKGEGVDAYRLTSHAVKLLEEKVVQRGKEKKAVRAKALA